LHTFTHLGVELNSAEWVTAPLSLTQCHFALLHQRLEYRCLVALSHRQQEGHRLAIALTAQMDLGAKPAFAIAQCFGVGITAAWVLST